MSACHGPDPIRSAAQVGDGCRSRLIQLITALEADPTVSLTTDDGGRLSVPSNELTLRAVARRCGVSSPSTAGEWLSKWRAKGWLSEDRYHPQIRVDKIYPTPGVAHDIEPNEETGRTSVRPSPTPRQAAPVLEVLLDHLARALERDQTDLITRLDSWIAQHLALNEPARTTAARPRGAAREDRPGPRGAERSSRGPERSEGDSSFLKDQLTHSPTARQNTARSTARTREQLEHLLAPTLEIIRKRHLTPMTNWRSLEDALRPYDNEQIAHAQNTLAKQIHANDNITSPIGLLVRQARDANPDYFPPTTGPSPRSPVAPASAPVTTEPPRSPADQQAALTNVRDRLTATPRR